MEVREATLGWLNSIKGTKSAHPTGGGSGGGLENSFPGIQTDSSEALKGDFPPQDFYIKNSPSQTIFIREQ